MAAPTDPVDLLMWCTACPTEAAAEIERLTRELDAAKMDLMHITESERCADNERDEMRDRALAAESSLSEAVKAAREDEREGCALVAENAYTGRTDTGVHPLQIARAIRARGAVLGSGRGSTQKEVSE